MSMLCGIPASLFSNAIWNAASAGTLRALTSNWRLSALSSTTSPDGAADAPALPDGVSEPPGLADGLVNSSVQQAGYGVAPGSGAYAGSTQPSNVRSSPVAGSFRGSNRPGSMTRYS